MILNRDIQHQDIRLTLVMVQNQEHQHQRHKHQGQHPVVMELLKEIQDVIERKETEKETELGIRLVLER